MLLSQFMNVRLLRVL